MKKYIFKRGRCINPEREFIICSDDWYIQYQFIVINGKYQFGLTLRYLNKGTDFKYIFENDTQYATKADMKKAIKSFVAKWMLNIQSKYQINEIPLGQLQEFVTPQLKLF